MKDTVGKISRDLILKNDQNDHAAEEQMREQLKDYETNFNDKLLEGKKVYNAGFYIVVLTKKERLMQNVIRNYFFHRRSCPTPDYDQVVYKIDADGTHHTLWVIPAKDICKMMRDNVLSIPSEEKELLGYVLDFYDGSLFKKAKQLNGEELTSPFIKKEKV